MDGDRQSVGRRPEAGRLDPSACFVVPARGSTEQQLEHLKENLLRPILSPVTNTNLLKELCWAANEAAALAWFTLFPVLVFPSLLEEKIQLTFKKWEKQQKMLQCPAT